MSKKLELTLKRQWFDMILSGEKKEEYREPTKWILSRLQGKTYDTVRFRNGYASDAPVFECQFKGWRLGKGKAKWGGDQEGDPYVIIKLGSIVSKSNL